jgi:hypothetical protein
MITNETMTTLSLSAPLCGYDAELIVRHDMSYSHTFHLIVGCVDEWMTVEQLTALRNLCNAGLRKAKALDK